MSTETNQITIILGTPEFASNVATINIQSKTNHKPTHIQKIKLLIQKAKKLITIFIVMKKNINNPETNIPNSAQFNFAKPLNSLLRMLVILTGNTIL